MKRPAQIERRHPGIVRLQPSNIPELAANLVEAVRRTALEHQSHRRGLVRHLEPIVDQADRADDDDGAAVVEAWIRENHREVRRAARLWLRRDESGERKRDQDGSSKHRRRV